MSAARTGSRRASPRVADESTGATRPHDPRIDEPTRTDRHRVWWWLALLALCPLCVGVVVWVTLSFNGSYPTVKAPVPAGWQPVDGIYASFSVPKAWTLQQGLSDAVGDVYYAGPGGGAGESVTEASRPPSTNSRPPEIVGTFLQQRYVVSSFAPYKLTNASLAWRYRFKLADGTVAVGIHAWVRSSETEVWLVASPSSATVDRVLSTLTLSH
ncbi:MAG TPA: hypothetical protein VED59_05360 [Acidimicrobiales bacterium]|nr:hypothetical protein [Acidimicrobiales bacterium]